jgi:hypothetical protein
MASTVAHYRHGFSGIEVCAGIFIRMSLEHLPEEFRAISASGARAACRCGSLPVWQPAGVAACRCGSLPQCDGRRFCLSLRHEFGIFYAAGRTENEFKSNP